MLISPGCVLGHHLLVSLKVLLYSINLFVLSKDSFLEKAGGVWMQ